MQSRSEYDNEMKQRSPRVFDRDMKQRPPRLCIRIGEMVHDIEDGIPCAPETYLGYEVNPPAAVDTFMTRDGQTVQLHTVWRMPLSPGPGPGSGRFIQLDDWIETRAFHGHPVLMERDRLVVGRVLSAFYNEHFQGHGPEIGAFQVVVDHTPVCSTPNVLSSCQRTRN